MQTGLPLAFVSVKTCALPVGPAGAAVGLTSIVPIPSPVTAYVTPIPTRGAANVPGVNAVTRILRKRVTAIHPSLRNPKLCGIECWNVPAALRTTLETSAESRLHRFAQIQE